MAKKTAQTKAAASKPRKASAAKPKAAKLKAASPARSSGSTSPSNLVALPIVRAAISAFDGASAGVGKRNADVSRANARVLREEYIRLSRLPKDQLLERYRPTGAMLDVAKHADATIKRLLPAAGDGVWAREAAGRINALALLKGGLTTISAPSILEVKFKPFSTAPGELTNLECKARFGASLPVLKAAVEASKGPEEIEANYNAYAAAVKEWNRLNAQEIEGAAAYQPGLENLTQATKDLEAAKKTLERIKATADAISTVVSLIMTLAPFLI